MTQAASKPLPHTRAVFTVADEDAVLSCIRSGMVAHGARVRAFEAALAERLQARDAVTVSSGTAAIVLALRSVGVSAGHEVILPTYVCRAVYEAVRALSATPVLVDNDRAGRRCISQESVRAHLTSHTKAIIAVDTLGEPAPIDALRTFGLPIIEDACQGFGGVFEGRSLGLRGDVGVISFHGTKLLPIGDGGAVVCGSATDGERLRNLREGEAQPPHAHARSGDQLSDLSAALGMSVLSRLDDTLRRRAQIAARYRQVLQSAAQVELPTETNVPYRFPVRVLGADDATYTSIAARFLEHGVSVRRGVDAMNHVLFPPTKGEQHYPIAEQDFRETVSIPLYESLDDEEVAVVENAIKAVFYSC